MKHTHTIQDTFRALNEHKKVYKYWLYKLAYEHPDFKIFEQEKIIGKCIILDNWLNCKTVGQEIDKLQELKNG